MGSGREKSFHLVLSQVIYKLAATGSCYCCHFQRSCQRTKLTQRKVCAKKAKIYVYFIHDGIPSTNNSAWHIVNVYRLNKIRTKKQEERMLLTWFELLVLVVSRTSSTPGTSQVHQSINSLYLVSVTDIVNQFTQKTSAPC